MCCSAHRVWISASVADPTLAGWWKNYSDWFPSYLRVTAIYVGLTVIAHVGVQQAVRLGWLPEQAVTLAPDLGPAEQEAIESMLEREVLLPEPSEEACLRHYAANKPQHVIEQAVHLRHILFAVTPGVDVQKLAQRAEISSPRIFT